MKLLLAAVALGLTLAACTSPAASGPATPASPATADPLAGTSWALTTVGDQPVPGGVTAGLKFAGAAVSGSSGCNTFSGPYRVDGQSLHIGPLASTRMACDAASMAFEQAYLAALDGVTTWAVPQDAPMGTQLTLTGTGAKLVFGKPAGA